MADLIQFRRDTKANWATANPVLALGEPGLETDTRRVKYGDGTTAWNNLLYGGGAGDGAYNISEANNGATYADLSAALAAVPTSERRGGMSIKFILRTNTGTEEEPVYKDDYVQYRLIATAWSTSEADWQGVDNEPTAESENLVKSGGVFTELNKKVDVSQDSKVFYITDGSRNIIAKVDKNGVHSVDFRFGQEDTSLIGVLENEVEARGEGDAAVTALVKAEESRAKGVENTKLNHTIEDNKFLITDSQGFIIAKIDNKGIHAPNLFEGKFDDDKLLIMDKDGYIIAKVDKNGVHSAKDKHAVACMVLSEAYYPTAAPVRDGEGNVTYVEVMFETGVRGKISITYESGNSSSVAVVYGNYNYTITINRDEDGNVETVSVTVN